MTASPSSPHDAVLRREVVQKLAHYLRQYPYDLIDAKRLLQRFHVSVEEFTQALARSHLAEDRPASPAAPPMSVVRPEAVNTLLHHLRQYPQDIVDIKRLMRDYSMSAIELQHTLLLIDSSRLMVSTEKR